jgi:DNA topoisomerase-1
MRTDSQNMSKIAIDNCKKYIIEKYGNKYSNPLNYSSSSHAQEAHEAIRPTNINIEVLESNDKEQTKLYNLIWKRTIASQMASAKINIQTIYIDTLNNNQSILNNNYWYTIYKNIIFDGYLKIYDNNSSESEDNYNKIDIKINSILKFNKIKIFEEYNKLPLRYNEANLVKFLEKNNIGRPSTYASIISKIIERNYVEIKDIKGITKPSNIIELNKKYNIEETNKDVIIGNEFKKIIPIRIDIEFDSKRYKENILWNLDDESLNAEQFSKLIVGDCNLN